MKHTLLIKTLCASAAMTLGVFSAHSQGIIHTFAGNGIAGFGGDGGPALSASFSEPSGVAVDAAGNILVADKNNYRIRKITPSGIVSTVAGSGSFGYAGMGGLATAAGMEYPNAIFVDAAGNYLITDFYADCAYGIAPSGMMTNICGHGAQGCTGDGGDAPLATMELPNGICKDASGNVYIADYGNNRVRKIDGVTGLASTYAGDGTFGYSPDGTLAVSCAFQRVTGVAVDNAGTVYISDGGNHIVRKVDADGKIRTVAGVNWAIGNSGDGEDALNGTLNSPAGLYVNSVGNMFICDLGNNNVRVMNLISGTIHTLAGNGTLGFAGDGGSPTAAMLNQPTGVWEDPAGVIYIADGGNERIRKVVGSGYRAAPTTVSTLTADDVKIFPNPSDGTFSIQTTTLTPDMSVNVYNVVGEKVYEQAVTQVQTNVSINQPSGVYQLVIKSSAGSVTRKIVLEK